MIHGVPDKLNIYVKKVMEGSVAGIDGRILVNDHIVEVNICQRRYSGGKYTSITIKWR